MKTFPNPVEVEPTARASAEAEPRNVFCRLYERCLDTAVKNDWRAFSCQACALAKTESERPSARQFASQRNREDWI
jgi:hypothetical protein